MAASSPAAPEEPQTVASTPPPEPAEPAPSAAPYQAQPQTVAAPPPSPVVSSEKDFDVVEVFYGTDRQPTGLYRDALNDILFRAIPTIGCVLLTAIFGLIALTRRSAAFFGLAICSLGIAGGLGYFAASQTIDNYRLAFKEGVQYTSERSEGGEVHVGVCEVTIPHIHQVGELEGPSILRLEVKERAERHVILRKTEKLEDQPFYDALRARVARSPRKELFVFVHGFNVPFEDAARRTAQMAYDMEYQGAPIFFSWPANDKLLLTYAKDETNVAWAAPHLKRFLLDIVEHTDAESINLIAHSMGNRALTTALRELQLEMRDQSRLFNQVVLAAPDIDADDFKLNIAPAIAKTADRVTLYASARDQALAASQLVHRYPRAGDSIVLVPGIETIDVSAIDGGPWGHSYYGSSDPILQDLRQLLLGQAAIENRSWLTSSQQNGQTYWIFRAETAAGGQGVYR